METRLEYSFEDEVANRFCYDMLNKKIEIHFSGYYDALTNQYINKNCVFVIDNWTSAKSKLSSESFFHDLDSHIGVIGMILSMQRRKTTFELTVNTVDNRYIDLWFENSQVKLQD